MKIPILCLVAIIALISGGCASSPSTRSAPKSDSDSAAALGMLLIAGAAQDPNSAMHKLWQVKIPPAAIIAIKNVEDSMQRSGGWPTREEVFLPAGIKEVVLTPRGTDVDMVIMKTESDVLFRCRLLKDGTVVIDPAIDEMIRLFLAVKSQPTTPAIPIVLPVLLPKK